jgi:gliding motility-associated-like protein
LAFYRFFVNGFPEQSGSQSVLSLGSLTQGLTVQATAESRYRCPVRNFSELDIEVQERPEVNLTTNLVADSLCEGDSALLIASSGFPTYRFLSGDSVLSVQSSNRFAVDSALPRGSAAVTVRDTLGCAGDTSEAVSYRYVAIPQISATASADSICIGEEVELRIEASPSFTDLEYAWSNGRQEASFRLTPGRSISLSAAIRRDGCPAGRDSVGLFVDTTGTPELSLSAPDTVCVEEAYLLQAGGAETYRWREAGGGDAAALLSATDVAQPTLTVGLPDTPSLSLVLEGRNRICRSESPLTLPVSRCLTSLPAGAIPQIITPNGDGINDVWRIEGIDFEDFRNNRVRILNRWGQEVFTASPYRNNWSGENKEGEELPAGTYYYVVDLGTGAEKRTGFVIIQR